MQQSLVKLIFDNWNKRSDLYSLIWYTEKERAIYRVKQRLVIFVVLYL
jgi:hypothetical protein